ncbi:MAG: oligosaccharide flippase family protein, partial [Alphaproteobacteria bacterium]
VVLARALGPEMYGLLAYGQSWYGIFLPITALGFAVVLAREAGVDRARGRLLAARMFTLRGPLTLLAAVLCAGIGWAVNTESTVRLLLNIFSLALVGRAVATMAEDVFAAFEISHLTLRQEAVFRPAEVGLGLAILAGGGGVLEIAALHAAIHVAQGVRGMVLVRRHVTLRREPLVWQPLAGLLTKGMLAGSAGLLSAWLLQGPLVLYAQSAVDKASIGHLALAMQALVLLCNLPWAIGRAALPVLSRASVRQDGSDVHYADAMLRLAFAFAAAFGLAGMAIGPWLMASVFGAGYTATGELLGPALWLLLPLTAATALNPLLMARESYVAAGLSALAGAVTMTLAVPILTTSMGPTGALAGAGAGLSVWAVCLLGLVARRKGVTIGLAVVRPSIVVAITLIAYVSMQNAGASPWWSLAVAWLVLLLAGPVLCLATTERRAIATFLTRMR